MYFISVFIVSSLKPLLKFVGKARIRAYLNGSYFLSSFQTISHVLVHILGFFLNSWLLAQGTLYFHPNSDLFNLLSIYYFISSSTLEVGRAVFINMPILKMKNL